MFQVYFYDLKNVPIVFLSSQKFCVFFFLCWEFEKTIEMDTL